jgi:hypothetical protein
VLTRFAGRIDDRLRLLQDLTGTLEHARAVLGSGVSLEGDVWGADADEDEENEETGYERK